MNDGHEDLQAHGYITTFTGARFSYREPGPFRIRDIAHALSLLPRFLGHTKRRYSVAEHSIMVADILRDAGGDLDLQRAGLLHDAHEAYFGDLPSPLKWAFPEIATAERRVAVCLHLCLLPNANKDDWRLVKQADDLVLHVEAAALFEPVPAWVKPIPDAPRIAPVPPEVAEQRFLDRAQSLGLV